MSGVIERLSLRDIFDSFIIFVISLYRNIVITLFRSKINRHWDAVEVPHFAHAVLDKALVGVAHILRQVAEEDELRVGGGQLGDILDLDPFAFDRRRRILLLDDGQQGVVEFGSADAAAAGLKDLLGGL